MKRLEGSFSYFLIFAALFFAGIWANALRHGWNTPVVAEHHITLASTADQVISGFGLADPATYARGAQVIVAGFASSNSYYFKYWPPGMMVLEAVLLWLVPVHFVLALFTVTAVIWSSGLAYLALVLRHVSGSRLFPLVLLGIFVLPLFRVYLFGAGIVLSESLSIALFLPGMLMLTRGLQRGSFGLGLLAGALTAAAALIRAQLLLAMLALIGSGFLALAVYAALYIKHRIRPGKQPRRMILTGIGFAATYVLFVYGYALWNDGGVVHMEYEYTRAWVVRPVPPIWEDTGGIGVLCQADPETCARLRSQPEITWQQGRAATLHVLSHHFLTVAELKAGYFARYFMAKTSWFPVEFQKYDFRENIPLGLLDLAGLVGSAMLARQSLFAILAVIQFAVWTGTLSASFLIMHIEVRYFYIGKAMGLAAAFLVLAESWKRWCAWRRLNTCPMTVPLAGTKP